MARRDITADDVVRELFRINRNKDKVNVTGSSSPTGSPGGSGIGGNVPINGMLNPMVIRGDLIYGGVAGSPNRLPIGTVGQVLMVTEEYGHLYPRWQSLTVTSYVLDSSYNYIVTSGGTRVVASSSLI